MHTRLGFELKSYYVFNSWTDVCNLPDLLTFRGATPGRWTAEPTSLYFNMCLLRHHLHRSGRSWLGQMQPLA